MVWLPHWPKFHPGLPTTLGLSRIITLLKAAGSPHLKLPPTVHIAGTNGKGSTVAFIQSIFEAAGLRVHRYTSPHIISFNERILLAGQEIQDDYLFSILEECRIISEQHNIVVSFFEGVTAAAFLAFSRIKAEILLLEVGLGGRLDATNVIESPLMSVITPISYDHEKILGCTLEQIAYEKACIMKPGRPCVVGMQTRGVYGVLSAHAQKIKAPLIQFECDFGVSITEAGNLEYKSGSCNIATPAPSLAGYHQYINAATAIAAVSNCHSFSDEIFRAGITSARWQGRLEKVAHGALFNTLPRSFELWLDGAHNENGAQAIAAWLADQPKKETFLILGMTKNRDVNKFLKHFKGLAYKIICVNVYCEPLSYPGERIPTLINDSELKNIATHATTLPEALSIIQTAQKDAASRILITGSLFLVSDFLVENGSV